MGNQGLIDQGVLMNQFSADDFREKIIKFLMAADREKLELMLQVMVTSIIMAKSAEVLERTAMRQDHGQSGIN
jgi:hypothetical protein